MCNNISEAFDRARVGNIVRERNLGARALVVTIETLTPNS